MSKPVKSYSFPEWYNSQGYHYQDDLEKYLYPRVHKFVWTGPEGDPPGASVKEGREILIKALSDWIEAQEWKPIPCSIGRNWPWVL